MTSVNIIFQFIYVLVFKEFDPLINSFYKKCLVHCVICQGLLGWGRKGLFLPKYQMFCKMETKKIKVIYYMDKHH